MNRRRALFAIIGLGLEVAAPRKSSAQPARKIPVVGLLDTGERLEWWAAFRQELRALGYVEAQNVAFQARYAAGRFEQLSAFAEELVRLKVDVIVTAGTVAAQAARRATSTIPIVKASGSEETGSLARPGANVTGVTTLSSDLSAKRFELLQELVPKLSRLAVLWHQGGATLGRKELETVARSSKVALHIPSVKTTDDIAGAFSAMLKERPQAVFVIHDAMFWAERQRISDLAIKHRLPSIYGPSEYADAGGLCAYGPSYVHLFRRAAAYVDKILKGAKPGDLPIEQPTKLELILNMKTAKALGLKIPPHVLARADRIIE